LLTISSGDVGDQGVVGPGHVSGPKRPRDTDLRLAVDMIEPLSGHLGAAGHTSTVRRGSRMVHRVQVARCRRVRNVTTASFSRGGEAVTVAAWAVGPRA
jgi:hypothetical protein